MIHCTFLNKKKRIHNWGIRIVTFCSPLHNVVHQCELKLNTSYLLVRPFYCVASKHNLRVRPLRMTPSLLYLQASPQWTLCSYLSPFSILIFVKSILIDLIPYSLNVVTKWLLDWSNLLSLLSVYRELSGCLMWLLVATLEFFIS